MKKVFIVLILLFFTLWGFSQTTFPNTQLIGNKTAKVQTPGAFESLTGYIFRNFTDTTEANVASYISATPFILILTEDSTLWVRNENASRWLPVSSSGGGSVTGATNALQVIGTDIGLGGTATQNTTTTWNGFTHTQSWTNLGANSGLTLSGTGTASSNTNTILNIETSGSTSLGQRTYGAQITNSRTGVGGANVALRLSAVGKTNGNFALIIDSGFVGIGESLPGSKLWIRTNNMHETEDYQSGIVLSNDSIATPAYSQVSPTLSFAGQGWKTDATAGSEPSVFKIYNLPAAGTAAPGGTLRFLFSNTTSGGNSVFGIGSGGQMYDASGSAGTSGYIPVSAGANAAWSWGSPSLVSVPINNLLAATATNSINNAGHTQEWAWNSLGNGAAGLKLTSGAGGTIGSDTRLLEVLRTSTYGGLKSINIASINSNGATIGQTTYAIAGMFSSRGGTIGTATKTNIGLYGNALNADLNYALYTDTGKVKIRDLTPNTIVGVDADTNLVSAALSGLTFDGTTLSVEETSVSLQPFGRIYNDSNWANITDDFDTFGSSTITDSSGTIVMSGGPSAFTAGIAIDVNDQYNIEDYFTNLEYWTFSAKIRVIQNGIFGLGIYSNQVSGSRNTIATINTTTGQSGFNVTSASNLSTSIGDWLLITASRNGGGVTVSVRNITTNSATITTNSTYTLPTEVMPNTIGQFAMFNHSGKFYVDSINIYSMAMKNADVGFMGTSKTQGYNATMFNRFSEQLKSYFSANNWGSASSVTQDWEKLVPEIIAMAPKNVIMENPCNDLRLGVNTDSTKARYSRIATSLRNANIDVFYIDAFHETGSSPAAWLTYLGTWANPDSVIYAYNITNQTGFLAADNVHLTTFGDSLAANIILGSHKISESTNITQGQTRFVWNQEGGTQGNQPAYFNIASTNMNVINGYLTVGTGAVSSAIGNIPLRVRGGTNLNLFAQGFGSSMYLRFLNDPFSGGAPGIVDYSSLTFNTFPSTQNLVMNSTGAVFNEGSADLDLRVESDGNANMLVIDGGLNVASIGGAAVSGQTLSVYGNLNLPTAGNKINIATGANASVGTSTLVAGTVTVNTTAVTANSKIFLTVGTPGGTQGFLSIGTITAATSFVINSTSATETSAVNWIIIN